MCEKLFLAASLTLLVHIFAGVGTSAKLPVNFVLRSSDRPTQIQKLPLVKVPASFKSNVKS
ncbi:hypothetical protein [Microcoleus sp. CAWBG58]|uniref:hypothetical protein n=1 Tax=Microcoleus sp. CAWBG58 TaxID=2841651 RepID=UPI0025E200CD|nr:hypothetical protein [Microcoleus sp. CAWBG58]